MTVAELRRALDDAARTLDLQPSARVYVRCEGGDVRPARLSIGGELPPRDVYGRGVQIDVGGGRYRWPVVVVEADG